MKIGDFTVALEITRNEVRVNDALGTAAFLAPEVHSSESYIVQPLDIWAFGVTLYLYLFSGVLPFSGETNDELRTSILTR